jgi:4-amino-4-deoxy-L-arabinose transferase-like glycosyltransferase
MFAAMTFPTAQRAIAALLLLSSLLLGLAQAALLPPFEGFDETGHYSYIQQVAETGQWPRKGGTISRYVEDLYEAAPITEMLAAHAPWRYHAFFADPERRAAARETIHGLSAQRAYTPGKGANGMVQHPPLYYFAMAPVYLATKRLSLADQLFVLRSASYLLAWGALCITVFAALTGKMGQRAMPVVFAASAWPLIFPMWLPEMGRLGNDSLVAMFAACLFILAWRVTASVEIKNHALLGVILGLALLTKATFLPASTAILLVLGAQMLLARGTPDFARRIKALSMTVAILVAICGWWYAVKFVATGSAIGANDVSTMVETGGLIAGLKRNLNIDEMIRMPLGFALSFLWAGTWSFVVPPRSYILPLMAMTALIGCGAWRWMRREGVHPVDWFALLMTGLFLASLTYYSFVLLSVASGTAPAWYLHAMAPVLALLAGYGISEIMSGRLRAVLIVLLCYPLVFLPAMTVMNALYFAGCVPKLPNRNYYAWSSATKCLADYPRMYENLAVLAYPKTGTVLFVIGWALAVTAMAMALRSFRAQSASRLES